MWMSCPDILEEDRQSNLEPFGRDTAHSLALAILKWNILVELRRLSAAPHSRDLKGIR